MLFSNGLITLEIRDAPVDSRRGELQNFQQKYFRPPKLCVNQFQARTSTGHTPGEFFEIVKSPAPGQNVSAKARPPGQKHLPLGSILEDLISLSCYSAWKFWDVAEIKP